MASYTTSRAVFSGPPVNASPPEPPASSRSLIQNAALIANGLWLMSVFFKLVDNDPGDEWGIVLMIIATLVLNLVALFGNGGLTWMSTSVERRRLEEELRIVKLKEEIKRVKATA